jgi:hypothetical protein
VLGVSADCCWIQIKHGVQVGSTVASGKGKYSVVMSIVSDVQYLQYINTSISQVITATNPKHAMLNTWYLQDAGRHMLP